MFSPIISTRRFGIAVAALVQFHLGISAAQIILDQSVIPPKPPPGEAGIGSLFTPFKLDTAQTFTVGMAGLLSRVDVFISVETYYGSSASVLWDVRPVSSSGVPLDNSANALASGSFSLTQNVKDYSFRTLDLSQSPVPVFAGQKLAVVLSTTSGSLGWGGAEVGYAGGVMWQRSETFNDGFAWHGDLMSGYDLGFKTFIIVPEPSAVALLIWGALVFGIGRYCRRFTPEDD